MLCFPYSSDNKFDALIINKDKEEEFLGALNVYAQHYEAAVVRDNTQLHQPSHAAVEDRETYEYSCDSDSGFESENGTVGFANASTPCLEELENSDDEEELRLALSFGVSSSSKQGVNALTSDGHRETLGL